MSGGVTAKVLSRKEMNSYRFTSMEEPGDERMTAGIEAALSQNTK